MWRAPKPAAGTGSSGFARRTSGRSERAGSRGKLRSAGNRRQVLAGGNRAGGAREHLVHPAGPGELGNRSQACGYRRASAKERERVALLRILDQGRSSSRQEVAGSRFTRQTDFRISPSARVPRSKTSQHNSRCHPEQREGSMHSRLQRHTLTAGLPRVTLGTPALSYGVQF